MMSTPARVQPSGAQKRRLKDEKEKNIKRMAGSMLKYAVKLHVADPEPTRNNCDPELQDENNCDHESPFEDENNRDSEKIVLDSTIVSGSGSESPTTASDVDLFHLEQNDEIYLKKLTEDVAFIKNVNDEIREHLVQNPPSQNIQFVTETERMIGSKKRCLSENHFYRYKSNGEKVKRDWLTLSPTALALFCWICKLFSQTITTMSGTGFTDWKHATERLREHENSYSHREAVCLMIQRREVSCRVDCKLLEQLNCESKYWYEVLRRVVAVTKFLAIRGLPFFGRNETIGSCSNGNFLGCMELISEFDPFLAKHLQKYGNPGSGRTSYLSSTTLNEFIDLMANKVSSVIIQQIKSAKFYSIIVDSTPDFSHTDQLTFVIRYVSSDCEPVERFLRFIPISGHSAEYLEETVISSIENVGLHIADCRGQSYDNASNMAGKYTGLQARLKMLNPLAEFVPCAAHSLNLVVVKAVECNGKILDFFTFLQEMYNFFSASTHRWKLLSDKICGKKQALTLKSRSGTRWCANAAATRALKENYKDIILVLLGISVDTEESPSTRNEANSLHKKILKFETAMCATVWDSILQRIDCVSKSLQNPQLDLSVVSEYFHSLIEYVHFVRDNYDKFEEKACELVGHKDYSVRRIKKTPKSAYDGPCAETVFNSRDSFKVSCYYAACDTLITHLTSRMSAYESILKKFSCLFATEKQTSYEKAKLLQSVYSNDLEDAFADELVHVFSVLKNQTSVSEKLRKICNFGVKDTFSNVETALKLFLTLPLSNCTGERSFSLLKRIKSPLRNLIADAKLSSLALLSMESDITDTVDYEDVITSFTAKKLRKKCIKNI